MNAHFEVKQTNKKTNTVKYLHFGQFSQELFTVGIYSKTVGQGPAHHV